MTAALSLERVLVVAPHPDDETIATGALIQRVVAAGGRVRVVFVTDGDNNVWAQRLAMKKWTITAEERAAWGDMRREEARSALTELGAPAESAIFLGYPDRALSDLARCGDRRVIESMGAIVSAFDPTLVVTTSILDLHADHRAVALFTYEAAGSREIVTSIVHGRGDSRRIVSRLELAPEELARKRAAIERHESQLRFSRARFLAYARPVEVFYREERDILRPDTFWSTWSSKTRHGLRVITHQGPGDE